MVDPKSLTPEEIAFLESLPRDSTHIEVTGAAISMAHALHLLGLCFVSSGPWPAMCVRRTFDTQKVLSRV